ncbi:MAG: 2-C-methyl-D-erythritol 4-phosphate cytidylyltransferase [Ruminococcus sp.]|nr:2-C-methyl-D-erythritol 4-phosphate cytidylyltransferase [Ruminococcus sp.]
MGAFVSAIIVAAGDSTRMGINKSKQFIKLKGEPVIKHTLWAFEISDVINSVVVVCREQDENEIKSVIRKGGFGKVKAVVYGGDTRDRSVKNGVQACDERTTHFAIHDGARPLVSYDDIKAVVSEAIKYKAAALGTLVTDTIKIVDENNNIISTPDRSTLRAVQTPQVFEKKLYLKALREGSSKGITDDCQLVESIGESVKIVIGSEKNIKLTTQNDILIAESLI